VVVIPHPSGLNRILNQPMQRRRIGAALREAIDRAKQASEVAGR